MQGDVIEIYNTSGSLVMGITYDAWGNFTDTISSQDVVPTTEQAIALGLPFRYRSYYYDSETGFYYLNSRYYDPQIRRFINADGYVNANGDLNGFNMFAYCSNNPVMYVDPNGEFVIAATLSSLCIGAIILAVGCLLIAITSDPGFQEDVSNVIDAVKTEIKDITETILQDEKEKEKDTTASPPSNQTVIYRYYSSKTENLSPRQGIDYDGLSFSTKPPRAGVPAVVTTIEQVNATGVLTAIQTSGTHVVIIPTTGTVNQWMREGQSSIWTQTLSGIVVEWDGGF